MAIYGCELVIPYFVPAGPVLWWAIQSTSSEPEGIGGGHLAKSNIQIYHRVAERVKGGRRESIIDAVRPDASVAGGHEADLHSCEKRVAVFAQIIQHTGPALPCSHPRLAEASPKRTALRTCRRSIGRRLDEPFLTIFRVVGVDNASRSTR